GLFWFTQPTASHHIERTFSEYRGITPPTPSVGLTVTDGPSFPMYRRGGVSLKICENESAQGPRPGTLTVHATTGTFRRGRAICACRSSPVRSRSTRRPAKPTPSASILSTPRPITHQDGDPSASADARSREWSG